MAVGHYGRYRVKWRSRPGSGAAVGHGVRWLVVVLSTLGAFVLPWSVLTLAGAGGESALALASTASAAVLSAGGWYAARDPRAGRPEPEPVALPAGPLVMGPLPREPPAFQEPAELVRAVDDAMNRHGVAVVCGLTGGRGVGKTQLAGAYARSRIDAGWRVVAWIVAEEPGQVVAGLDELAEVAGVKGGMQDAQLAAGAARRYDRALGPHHPYTEGARDNLPNRPGSRRAPPPAAQPGLVLDEVPVITPAATPRPHSTPPR